ncbi:MAG TPA: hypothetical protein VH985_25440, partial [Candidatus Binatia bacterium]
ISRWSLRGSAGRFHHWIKGRGISENEAWKAVVIGLALDAAFARSKAFNRSTSRTTNCLGR